MMIAEFELFPERVKISPSYVEFAMPPKTPALLYCKLVSDPPGLLLPDPPVAAIDTFCPVCVNVTFVPPEIVTAPVRGVDPDFAKDDTPPDEVVVPITLPTLSTARTVFESPVIERFVVDAFVDVIFVNTGLSVSVIVVDVPTRTLLPFGDIERLLDDTPRFPRGDVVPVPPLAVKTGIDRATVPVVVIVPPVSPVPAVIEDTEAFDVLHVAQPIAPVVPLYVTGETPCNAVVDACALTPCVVDAVNGNEYPAANKPVSVPVVVTGEPEMVNPVGNASPTDVTVPLPPPHVVVPSNPTELAVTHDVPEPDKNGICTFHELRTGCNIFEMTFHVLF